MPFGCFRRSKVYNLNHQYDSKSIYSDFPKRVSSNFTSDQLQSRRETNTDVKDESINITRQISSDVERIEALNHENQVNESEKENGMKGKTDEAPSTTSNNHEYTNGNESAINETESDFSGRYSIDSLLSDTKSLDLDDTKPKIKRRAGVLPKPIHYDEDISVVKHPKSKSDEEFIKEAIAKNEFLSKVITGKRLLDVVDAFYKREIKAKEKIIKEGQSGSHMYIAAEGEFEVFKKGRGLINVMKPGDVFGELAILYNAKRFATIRSSTPAKIWVIEGIVYQHIAKRSNIEEEEEIVTFLQNVPILNQVGMDVLGKVARLLQPEFFETGTVIVKEGDQADKFYIISAGSVTITREDDGFVGQLYKGNCFGEKAILESITRQATITADSPGTECLTLTQTHFINHFGKIEDISSLTMPPQTSIIEEDVIVDNEYSALDLSEFKILKTLGVGGFGRVEFVQHKKDPSLTFALKYLKKYEMVQQEQQHHVINEMKIQMACNSPFIIRMYKTYKDNKYIYFLMEVCLGGDLWSLLQKQPNKRLDEKGARFVAGCVLEALGYLHARGIVYRDLKPENLLIDNKGYVKITDFGFAKRLAPNSKSGTFAGTPEYVAPEIILNRGHDKAVDYWAYGIFIYELLNGRTPFRSNDPSFMRTYNNILNGLDIVIFPSHIVPKAKSLITKLLKKSPEERLGCLRGGVDDIRKHKWFADFSWEKLRECKISSPYKPKLTSNTDWKYIDFFARDNDIPPDETSGWDDFF
ncbi:hypothetical protein HHI36_006642 [Cryptolaemus montrouzieri]|uniref:cGMP-dependent protein kinase n=1 Tax=Cryptolaemus montrouzieri TaxID=559131 RepID=A0ABD2NY17_9CUCU